PVFEFADELVGMSELGRRHDLGVGRLRPAVADVVADRAVQQRGVLRDHGDLRAQALLRDRGDVLAVDQDTAAFEVEEAQQQIYHRRLAGAGTADQADLFARPHGQGQAVDDAALAAVTEATSSNLISPRVTLSAAASGWSVSVIGRAMVIMPSWITPT